MLDFPEASIARGRRILDTKFGCEANCAPGNLTDERKCSGRDLSFDKQFGTAGLTRLSQMEISWFGTQQERKQGERPLEVEGMLIGVDVVRSG